jgi:hypothetical protein
MADRRYLARPASGNPPDIRRARAGSARPTTSKNASEGRGAVVVVMCANPTLIIANAYRRLNMWSAKCGANFDWVGLSISPYPEFLTRWLMIAAYTAGAIYAYETPKPRPASPLTRSLPVAGRFQLCPERTFSA